MGVRNAQREERDPAVTIDVEALVEALTGLQCVVGDSCGAGASGRDVPSHSSLRVSPTVKVMSRSNLLVHWMCVSV